MSSAPLDPLDPQLFAPAPARESCFDVKDRWRDCANLPEEHPNKTVEFLHRQMHEEIDSLEVSGCNLADFPDMDWDLCMSIAHQCADEARHVVMFRWLFEQRGGQLGAYPVLNFQYRIITKINTLIGRLAVQNRSFEAEGIDAIELGIETTRRQGDIALADLYEAQLADEIVHVRFANEWIRATVQRDPRQALHIASAMTNAVKAFTEVMGKEGTAGVKYGVSVEGRLEAGFTPEEVRASVDQGQRRQAMSSLP